jgi:hypothetical protein
VFFNGGTENVNLAAAEIILTDPFIYPVNADDYHILSIETGGTTNYIPWASPDDPGDHWLYAGYSSAFTVDGDAFDHYYSLNR